MPHEGDTQIIPGKSWRTENIFFHIVMFLSPCWLKLKLVIFTGFIFTCS